MTSGDAASTRARILEALAQIVAEGGLSDFSVQVVADRCGVSHRTVYRHFPTRESMLNGLVEQVSSAMAARGGPDRIQDLDDLAGAVAVNFPLFADLEPVTGAAVRFSVGTAIENRDRRPRSDAVAAAVEREGLPPGDAHQVAALLRHLASSRTWLLLRDAGLGAQETTSVATWAIGELVAAIRDGRGPSSTTRSTDPTRSTTP